VPQYARNDCCYDIPCDLCVSGESEYELLVDQHMLYMGDTRTCGEWSVLAEGELSQSDVCMTAKNDLFSNCCFKPCTLCKDAEHSINWNLPLTYEGLASTCLDVYLNLRSERLQEGDDRCQSIQFTVSDECCHKLPTNQCSLCQTSDGTYLNTNWNAEVNYLGEKVTCGDVNAKLSSEELDGILCLSARDDLWNQCCTPQLGGNTGLGGILPTEQNDLGTLAPGVLVPQVSDSDESNQSPGASFDDGSFTTFHRRNGAHHSQLLYTVVMLPFIVVATSFIS